MEYKGIKFDAIVATPCCGKSYVCDKYPNRFVDVDEVRLKCKYYVPKNITRAELEVTKGKRPFERRADDNQYKIDMEKALDEYVKQGKILIAAPHPEAIDYLVKNNIRFAFVYQNASTRAELVRRMERRGNSPELIKEFDDLFDMFLQKNLNENQSVVHYQFGKDEYLEDILKKFGCEL